MWLTFRACYGGYVEYILGVTLQIHNQESEWQLGLSVMYRPKRLMTFCCFAVQRIWICRLGKNHMSEHVSLAIAKALKDKALYSKSTWL